MFLLGLWYLPMTVCAPPAALVATIRWVHPGQHVVHSMHGSLAEMRTLVKSLRPKVVHALTVPYQPTEEALSEVGRQSHACGVQSCRTRRCPSPHERFNLTFLPTALPPHRLRVVVNFATPSKLSPEGYQGCVLLRVGTTLGKGALVWTKARPFPFVAQRDSCEIDATTLTMAPRGWQA